MKSDQPVTFETVRQVALSLPGVEEGKSYGTPAFRIGKKFLARLREDGETLALRIGFDERDVLMKADPETFFITEHYRGYPAVLVRLATVDPDRLREVLEEAWRQNAPKRLVAAREK
ncbi:MAG TPA: MmcQ/YjbR family DNA-binding protein [Thermoanaerobaculia bacterium]